MELWEIVEKMEGFNDEKHADDRIQRLICHLEELENEEEKEEEESVISKLNRCLTTVF